MLADKKYSDQRPHLQGSDFKAGYLSSADANVQRGQQLGAMGDIEGKRGVLRDDPDELQMINGILSIEGISIEDKSKFVDEYIRHITDPDAKQAIFDSIENNEELSDEEKSYLHAKQTMPTPSDKQLALDWASEQIVKVERDGTTPHPDIKPEAWRRILYQFNASMLGGADKVGDFTGMAAMAQEAVVAAVDKFFPGDLLKMRHLKNEWRTTKRLMRQSYMPFRDTTLN